MKTHYHPYSLYDSKEIEGIERAYCGVALGESSELTMHWTQVTCRICLKRRSAIEAAVQSEEDAIVEQLGAMADFMKRQVQ